MLKFTKLDRRHNGHTIMKYMVQPEFIFDGRDGRIRRFKEFREWMWTNYGPGCELDFVQLTPGKERMESVERWAWDTRETNLRIYLKGDEELTFIKLKWL